MGGWVSQNPGRANLTPFPQYHEAKAWWPQRLSRTCSRGSVGMVPWTCASSAYPRLRASQGELLFGEEETRDLVTTPMALCHQSVLQRGISQPPWPIPPPLSVSFCLFVLPPSLPPSLPSSLPHSLSVSPLSLSLLLPNLPLFSHERSAKAVTQDGAWTTIWPASPGAGVGRTPSTFTAGQGVQGVPRPNHTSYATRSRPRPSGDRDLYRMGAWVGGWVGVGVGRAEEPRLPFPRSPPPG